jgi:hypothetical protein
MRYIFKIVFNICYFFQTIYIFFKIFKLKQKNFTKFSVLFLFFIKLPWAFIKILAALYVKIIILLYNLFFFWPYSFLKILFRHLNIYLKSIFFFLVLNFLLYCYYFIDLGNSLEINFDISFENKFIVFFEPFFRDIFDVDYQRYLDFVQSTSFFLRNLEIEKTFYNYYNDENPYNKRNFFYHKALFSDFLRSKYVLNATSQVDWHHYEFMYARGWLNSKEILYFIDNWEFLKFFLFFKDFIIFLIIRYSLSDIFFICLKYDFLDNYVLTSKLNLDFELSLFKTIIYIFPDWFLLHLGFGYKYFFIVLVEYIFDHFFSFVLKLNKIYNIGPGNYALKKKLMRLSTDTKKKPYHYKKHIIKFLNTPIIPNIYIVQSPISSESFQLYPFSIPIDDTSYEDVKTTYLGLYIRNVFGNVIESSPIILERYDILKQTGYTDPRSHEFFIKDHETFIIRKPNYRLSEMDFWNEYNINHDFFDKSIYLKTTKKAMTFVPGFNTNNDSFFFGGDKVFLSKTLPRQIGWFFKGPFSFSSANLNYTRSVSTAGSTGILKKNRLNAISTNPFLNPAGNSFYRNWSPTGLNPLPQYLSKIKAPKIFADEPRLRRKAIKGGYKFRKELRHILFEEIAGFDDDTSAYPSLLISFVSRGYRYNGVPGVNLRGDFSFGNSNYLYVIPFAVKKLLFNQHRNIYTAFHTRGLAIELTVNNSINDHIYLYSLPRMCEYDHPFGYDGVNKDYITEKDRILHRTWKKKRKVKFRPMVYEEYPSAYPEFNMYPYPSNQLFMQNFQYKDTHKQRADFYDFWVNSILNSTFVSLEMGKMRLQFENVVPIVSYKRHIEESYNLRFISGIFPIFYFFKVFLYGHILVFKFLFYFIISLNFYFIFILFLFLRSIYFFLIIDLKNLRKKVYTYLNVNGFLFEKKTFVSLNNLVLFDSWSFSNIYKEYTIRYLLRNFLKLLFVFFFKRFKESCVELLYLLLEFFLLICKWFLKIFFFIFDFFFCKILIKLLILKYLVLKNIKALLAFLFLFFLFSSETIKSKGLLFYFIFILFFFIYRIYFFFVTFILFLLKVLFCVLFILIFSIFLRIINIYFNIDVVSLYPTYLTLIIVLFFLFCFSLFSSNFRKNLMMSDLDFLSTATPGSDLESSEQEEEYADEEDEEIMDEDLYSEEYDETANYDEMDYSHDFHSYRFLMMTTEGVVSTDVVRPSQYYADVRFLRRYYGKLKKIRRKQKRIKKSSKIPIRFFFRKEDNSFYKKIYDIFLFAKKPLREQKYFYHVRYMRPFFMHYADIEFPVEFYITYAIYLRDLDLGLFPRYFLDIVFEHWLKIYLAFYSYIFNEEPDFIESDITPQYNLFKAECLFTNLGSQFESDRKLLKLLLAEQEILDLDEEDFFDKEVWLDQFYYKRVYDIDLTDFNPIIINSARKKYELYNYSNARLDFLDFDILNNNSVKYFYYMYHTYSTRSKVYTRMGDNLPYMQRFAHSYYRFLPRLSQEVDIDYELGLNVADEGYYTFYKDAYMGFQLRESFFGTSEVKGEFFIKIMNPYECFDNRIKLEFFSNLDYYIKVLNLVNFPNLTKKEYERVLMFYNCTEKEWDNLDLEDNKLESEKALEVFDSSDFPVFVFVTFIFYLISNNYLFFWNYRTKSKGEGEDHEIENEIFDNILNSLEPTIFSTNFVQWLLEFPFFVIDQFVVFFYTEFLDLQDEPNGLVLKFIYNLLIKFFSITSLLDFIDFLIKIEIFFVRSAEGFFFYDLVFIILSLTMDFINLLFAVVNFLFTVVSSFLFK